ncbi:MULTISPECIES: putative lipid II flippase FtsW [Pseudovibrio]|uniref:putative lipid II flippase FtsW n=1 Tax=Stappiaceae TaxID=2821832 RepID=UPI002366588F|nr:MULTISPECIES: putative lipid II flippase FtsW [Pseudovibrio]MDD7910319.1 putative lipid II flippase FtsW [Pseudovibrio exalbescens]MDX5594034.1 putative lipid II flippase FtsW [Pseudovibrio sp. SPO723]
MVSRTDRSPFAEWLWTIDRYLLAGILILMGAGVVLSFAASPPVAERIGLDPYHFVTRQAIFLAPSVMLLLAVSALNQRMVRRVALLVLAGSIVLLIATLFTGTEIKGARRWVSLFGFSIQPAEFVKPSLVIVMAFLLSEARKRPEIPGGLFSLMLYAIVVALLVAQPDFGQTMLITMVLFALFFLNGLSWFAILPLGAVGVGGMVAGYVYLPHVRGRVERFLNPDSGDTFQIDRAIDSFLAGGWFGRGVGEGTVKRILPDSHTDFIFAVVAEEYGVLLCLFLVCVFAFVVLRGLSVASKDQDPFGRLATSGLIVLFGLQSCINMAVNLNLMPAKGMTLPFISYGGSSLVALALSMGFVLALTRRRLRPTRTPGVTVTRVPASSLV